MQNDELPLAYVVWLVTTTDLLRLVTEKAYQVMHAAAELASDGGPRFVATKGALGNTGGAAPLVDVALAVRTMQAGILPPTVTRGEALSEFRGCLSDAPVHGSFRRILVLSAGSQGGAGALVLKAAP